MRSNSILPSKGEANDNRSARKQTNCLLNRMSLTVTSTDKVHLLLFLQVNIVVNLFLVKWFSFSVSQKGTLGIDMISARAPIVEKHWIEEGKSGLLEKYLRSRFLYHKSVKRNFFFNADKYSLSYCCLFNAQNNQTYFGEAYLKSSFSISRYSLSKNGESYL